MSHTEVIFSSQQIYNKKVQYQDPLQKQVEEKDLMISQLKTDIYELGKSKGEMSNITNKFDNMVESTIQLDDISSLWNTKQQDITSIKQENKSTPKIKQLTNRNNPRKINQIEITYLYQELEKENIIISQIAQQRSKDIVSLQNEVEDAINLNLHFQRDKSLIQSDVIQLQQHQRQLKDEILLVKDEISLTNNTFKKLTEMIYDLKQKQKRMVVNITSQPQIKIDNLRNQQIILFEKLNSLQNQVENVKGSINSKERIVLDLKNVYKKEQNTLNDYRNKHTKQTKQNNQLQQRINSLQQSLKQLKQFPYWQYIQRKKEMQNQDTLQQLDESQLKKAKLMIQNPVLNDKITNIKKYIEILAQTNQSVFLFLISIQSLKLINEMKNLTQDDDELLHIYNRQNIIELEQFKNNKHLQDNILDYQTLLDNSEQWDIIHKKVQSLNYNR